MAPRTETELEELLSRPSPADIEAAARLDGDLVLLGVAGKMGPTLAIRARRAIEAANTTSRVIGVSRFSTPGIRESLERAGIQTIEADLLDPASLAGIPDARNVIFMAGRKFGSTGDEAHTWAMNVQVPILVCERFRDSRIVAFSSGNIYPLMPVTSGGAVETTPVSPVGEYAQSVLGRERMFEFASRRYGLPVTILRLNYAVELRYGVILDIGTAVFERRPVSLTMGLVNVIWQGDANSVCLRSFDLCTAPPTILNLTGPETLSVQYVAERFGAHFGIDPILEGAASNTALLNNAARCHRQFGYPSVTPEEIIEMTARWIGAGGGTLGKPTHFEARDGKY